ncbi:MAG TPA: hypothetical protein VM779_11360 [Thermoanaerobaculia bacterium]|nr:hypothetical protein [Thermoanaerobaculia bacterium]
MKKTAFLLAVLVAGAVPLAAQSTEFGVLYGGSSRSVDGDAAVELDDNFSFSRSSIEFYYANQLEPGTMFKIKLGRIETPVGLATEDGARFDVDGQVQHLDAVAEYRFSEPFGSAGLFAGIGLYRQVADRNVGDNEMDYGFLAGVNADFPISRRYGVILEATHHWTKLPFRPNFLTVSGGFRLRF